MSSAAGEVCLRPGEKPYRFPLDVEITDVWTNSLRGKVVRTEDEMGLRIAETPESVIARTRKENELGVGIYQP